MARVLFFGRLRDVAGSAERIVPLEDAVRLSVFRATLAAGDDALLTALTAASVRVAINASLLTRDADPKIHPDDEVAFMPPFSGG